MAKNKEMVNLWERQEGETSKQYEAFCIYRDMGIDRSIRRVAEELSKSNTLIGRWSRENDWVKRVEAYDIEQERIARIQQQKDIAKMRKNHASIASTMLITAAKALKSMKAEDIKPSDISRMVEVASKLERISRGDVGEVVEERPSAEPAAPAVQFYLPDNGRDPK